MMGPEIQPPAEPASKHFKLNNGRAEDEDSYEYLKLEVSELRMLLNKLLGKYREADDQLKAVNVDNIELLKENKRWQEQCFSAERQRILAEMEVQELLKKEKDMVPIMEYIEKMEKEKPPSQDQTTSTSDFLEYEYDTCQLCSTHLSKEGRNKKIVKLKRDDLEGAEQGLAEIKETLKKKTESANKSFEREKCKLRKINKLTWEVQSLKNLVNYKSRELDSKVQELQIKSHELTTAKKEIIRLHNVLSKLATGPPKSKPTQSTQPHGHKTIGKVRGKTDFKFNNTPKEEIYQTSPQIHFQERMGTNT